MATSQCAPLPTGGYEIEFVDSIPDSLSCPICLLPFRDPHLLSCCGAKYCEACIGRVKASDQPCPLCKQQFFSMLDKSFQRKVLGLKARCSRKKNGCQWEGELRHLDYHEREECMCALVECRYSCGVRIPRRQLVEHERDLCPQRPVDVKLESFMRKMEAQLTIERNRHEQEMAAIRGVLREERESHKQEIESKERTRTSEIEELKRELMQKFNADMASMREEVRREVQRKEQMILAEQRKIKDEHTSEMKEMVKSYTAETAALREEFKREMERKLVEQKKNMKGQVFSPQKLEQAQSSQRPTAKNEQIKRCPRCRVDIEKTGGCMHQTCGHCRYEFCWLCLIPWNTNCQSRHWFGER